MDTYLNRYHIRIIIRYFFIFNHTNMFWYNWWSFPFQRFCYSYQTCYYYIRNFCVRECKDSTVVIVEPTVDDIEIDGDGADDELSSTCVTSSSPPLYPT